MAHRHNVVAVLGVATGIATKSAVAATVRGVGNKVDTVHATLRGRQVLGPLNDNHKENTKTPRQV